MIGEGAYYAVMRQRLGVDKFAKARPGRDYPKFTPRAILPEVG